MKQVKINVVCGFYAFFFYIKEKIVGLVNILQDQKILGVTGPMRPVTVWVSIEACMILI